MKRLSAIFALAACLGFAATEPCEPCPPGDGSGSISGIITDSVTGLPIHQAKVVAGCCGQHAFTAEDGSYTIANLPAGTYTVKAMKSGAYVMKAYPSPVEVGEGQQVTGIDIALAPMGGGGGDGSIAGAVYDKTTGGPLAGAKVTAGCHRFAYTDDQGQYAITGLADGSYTVRAMKEGYYCGTWPDPVLIQGGNAVTGIDFYLTPREYKALD